MKLVIPMSGSGSRFVAAGYTSLKPLILVEGRPLIAHVLDMFPGEEDVIFVCNQEHLDTTDVVAVLKSLKPTCTIVTVPGKQKGPVAALSHALDLIPDEEDVMVSYCDFTQDWDYAAFKASTKAGRFTGAVPAYTGFHPHLLRKNLYAGIVADENNMMQSIQEKHCFTENPEDSYHSSGVYYFASGKLLKRYAAELIESGVNHNGEYYASMMYPLLLRDNLAVFVPKVITFMQWGTPEDLEEYEAWSRLIHSELGLKKQLTGIPENREELVKIPYTENSPEFQKSHLYWSNYFKKSNS
jgi:NDP-sugar pyrophosphorylase family protein